jgi:arabinan endo-1,5-alpha-L-arabinosidase
MRFVLILACAGALAACSATSDRSLPGTYGGDDETSGAATTPGHYSNPVISHDCPDPGVMATGSPATYYAMCTGGSFPILRSDDLITWEDTGSVVFPEGKAPWSSNGDRNWAPEIHEVDGRYVVYYTAPNGDDVLSIGAASGDSPTGPFVDRGSPLVEHPDGVIDANYVRDRDGRHYLVYKIDANADGRPTPIYLRELAPDGLRFVDSSEPVEILRNDPATWEGGLVEAPWLVERGGVYYLYYSGNVYDHRYRTGVARASSIVGPYEKHGAAILANDDVWVGPGHGSIVAVSGQDYYVYHAWRNDGSGVHADCNGRNVLVDAVQYQNGWPVIHDGTPSEDPMPAP